MLAEFDATARAYDDGFAQTERVLTLVAFCYLTAFFLMLVASPIIEEYIGVRPLWFVIGSLTGSLVCFAIIACLAFVTRPEPKP
jgi:hypothetical protein